MSQPLVWVGGKGNIPGYSQFLRVSLCEGLKTTLSLSYELIPLPGYSLGSLNAHYQLFFWG